MVFRQVIHDDLGCASYLVGDERAGVAAVVDPKLDFAEYVRLATYLGVQIEHILETHNHADHVSGHAGLAACTGARIHIHRSAGVEYEHTPFDDGWSLKLGAVLIRALHTPGHRPEHTSFSLTDTRRGESPWALLTGDSLFVGDIARPDLAVDEREGARGIFRALTHTFGPLPDTVEVWPAHLGGSLCGGPGMDAKICSTLGYERQHQRRLRAVDEETFIEATISAVGPKPPNFNRIVQLNRASIADAPASPAAYTVRHLLDAEADRPMLVDVRPDTDFAEAHIPASISLPIGRPGFGSKLAWIAGPDRPLIFIGDDDADARQAAGLAAAVGLRHDHAYLDGGMPAWHALDMPTEHVLQLTPPALRERWCDAPLQVLDVRERSEWHTGRIPGSIHAPYRQIVGIPGGIDPERPVAVVCASGLRAATGASLLQHHGAKAVIQVTGGGVPTWEREGWPLERPDPH